MGRGRARESEKAEGGEEVHQRWIKETAKGLKRETHVEKRARDGDGDGKEGMKERKEREGKAREDLSDHVAGANGVSNGVDQSLPALKHENVPACLPLHPARTRIVITSRLSSSESLSSLDPRSSFFSLPHRQLLVFRPSALSGADLYADLMRLKL